MASGLALIELTVAMAILAVAVIPLGFMLASERMMCRSYYHHAIAMEIVDGEMELLAAGEWRACREGTHPYSVHAESLTNLPPGRFLLTKQGQRLKLEWLPANPRGGGKVVREVTLP